MFNLSYFASLEFWIIIGTICLITEFVITGIGFLFLGFGALTNAVLIHYFPALLEYHYTSFGLVSFFWFILLWLPLKRYVYNSGNSNPEYLEVIGQEVIVSGNSLSPEGIGQVKWSGTIMNAKLDNTEKDTFLPGDKLYIVSIHGNILVCSKKPR